MDLEQVVIFQEVEVAQKRLLFEVVVEIFVFVVIGKFNGLLDVLKGVVRGLVTTAAQTLPRLAVLAISNSLKGVSIFLWPFLLAWRLHVVDLSHESSGVVRLSQQRLGPGALFRAVVVHIRHLHLVLLAA